MTFKNHNKNKPNKPTKQTIHKTQKNLSNAQTKFNYKFTNISTAPPLYFELYPYFENKISITESQPAI